MHTIKIDISDNVMFFLNNLPKKDTEEKLTDFFQSSPLKDITLERNLPKIESISEIYLRYKYYL